MKTGSFHKIYATSNFLNGRAFLQYAIQLIGAYIGILVALWIVVKKEQLLAYKKQPNREVDIKDIAKMNNGTERSITK